ncbi:MAG: hypothetical protein M3Y51_09685 [Actinomycetota bacterium]|nr:hypothetical protein [Actinomycetota bacterium]
MIGVDDVAELRSLLRRRDPVARSLALGTLSEWSGGDLDALGGRAVLEAASGSYPSIHGDHRHPAEMLAHMLWEQPRVVGAHDVARAYLVAGERVRRAFLHQLALRRDLEGLVALERLLGPGGRPELLPRVTTAALLPLLDLANAPGGAPNAPGGAANDSGGSAETAGDVAARIVAILVTVLGEPGWTWHAAELLGELRRRGHLDVAMRAEVAVVTTHHVHVLVDVCDRAAVTPAHVGDPVRSDRERLGVLARLLDRLDGVDRRDALMRLLSAADPRVSALGAARLATLGEPVAPERFGLIARDPLGLAELYDGLAPNGRLDLLPDDVDQVSVHEAMLTRWLAQVTELGRAPDEIEFLGERTMGAEAVHLFRFRMHAPHWSSARGWMIGAAGAFTYSCYAAEDECSLEEHVTEMRTTLADWPDRRADGAA